MKHVPIQDRVHPMGNGRQRVFRFSNGYGASVVRFSTPFGGGSYTSGDEWEVAVVKFIGENWDSFKLDYTTPLTSDVIGHVADADLSDLLDQIAALPQVSG